jgi:nicotinate-nucleotide adenylyltransferase
MSIRAPESSALNTAPPSPGLPPPGAVCLFGGSFDPVHAGHLLLAQVAIEQCQLRNLIFIPCWQSPHKADRPADAVHRIALLRLAVQSLPQATVSLHEALRETPSYSWETVLALGQTHAPAPLCWLLGADQWAALDSWSRPDVLRDALHFLVFPRSGIPIGGRPGWRHSVISVAHPASSTALRRALRGHPAERQAALRSPDFPPGTAHYIAAHQLYAGEIEPLPPPRLTEPIR